MPDSTKRGVKVRLDGSHLHVDARPARLVSMLRGSERKGSGAELVVTAHPVNGDPHTDTVPKAARQATFQLRDDVTVEASSAASFVAIAEETGRCLVIAYEGEVTVVPEGGDRFALTGDEALVVGVPGDPQLIAAADLTPEAHPELLALLDEVAAAVLGGQAPAAAVADKPAAEVDKDVAAANPAVAAAADKPAPTAAAGIATAGGAAAAGGLGAAASGQRRKKGKKGRPQPAKAAPGKSAPSKSAPSKSAPSKSQPTKSASKSAPVKGAAAGAAVGAAGAKVAAGGGGKPPAKVPPKTGGGGGGGDGHDDESYEDTPRDKRFLVGSLIVALLLAVAAVVFLSNGDDDTQVATGPSTTGVPATTEVTEPTTVTTEAPAAPTTEAPTTTAAPATTTAKPTTTTAAAAVADYSIEPKSCVQNGNSITYTASVKNDSSAPFDFTVDVSFKSADGSEVAKATANVTRLAGGRSAEFSATGTSSRNLAGTGASCDVVRVDAQPSA